LSTFAGPVLSGPMNAIGRVVKDLSFAYSPNRNVGKVLKLIYPDGSGAMLAGEKQFSASFSYSVKMGLPLPKSIEKFVSFDIDYTSMVDLGDASSWGKDLSALFKEMTKGSLPTVLELQNLASHANEYALDMGGTVILLLSKPTKTLFKDIYIKMTADLLVSLSGKGGTGLPPGMYFRAQTSDVLGPILDLLMQPMRGLFSAFGIHIPTFNLAVAADLGFYITGDEVAFEILNLPVVKNVRCIIRFSNGDISCTSGLNWNRIFAVVGQWIGKQFKRVFQECKKVFGPAVKTIAHFGQDVADFSHKAVLKGIEAAEKAGQVIEQGFKDAVKRGKRLASKVAKAFKKAGKAISKTGKKAGKSIAKTGKKAGKAIEKTGKKAGKALKKAFRKVKFW